MSKFLDGRTYDLGPTDYSLAPYYDQEEDTIAVYYPKGETIYCDRPRKVVVTIGCGDNVPQDDRDTNRDKGECNYIAKVYTRAICPILEELDKSITKPKRDKSLDDKTLCYSQESCSSADKKDLKDMPRKCKKSSDVFKLTKGLNGTKRIQLFSKKKGYVPSFFINKKNNDKYTPLTGSGTDKDLFTLNKDKTYAVEVGKNPKIDEMKLRYTAEDSGDFILLVTSSKEPSLPDIMRGQEFNLTMVTENKKNIRRKLTREPVNSTCTKAQQCTQSLLLLTTSLHITILRIKLSQFSMAKIRHEAVSLPNMFVMA